MICFVCTIDAQIQSSCCFEDKLDQQSPAVYTSDTKGLYVDMKFFLYDGIKLSLWGNGPFCFRQIFCYRTIQHHLPVCPRICPTYSFLRKPRSANKHFSVQFSTPMIPVFAEIESREVCVYEKERQVNAENSSAQRLQHMVDRAHDVGVVLRTCWRPHTGQQHPTKALSFTTSPLPVSLSLLQNLSVSPLRRQQEKDGEKGKAERVG